MFGFQLYREKSRLSERGVSRAGRPVEGILRDSAGPSNEQDQTDTSFTVKPLFLGLCACVHALL